MRCLIRRITKRARAGEAFRDQSIETDTLTIGRGTNQHVFLSDLHVALEHAVLRALGGGRFSLNAKTAAGVQVNGRLTQAAVVSRGDEIILGRCRLRLIAPPAEHDLALEVEERQAEAKAERRRGSPLSLTEAGLRRRAPSWLLFILVLGPCLLIPAAGGFRHAGGTASPAPAGWLPSDRIWESGPLSRAHRFFGDTCRDCHAEPFKRVGNAACLDCHAAQPAHSDRQELTEVAGLMELRCAHCHREHNGAEGLIITAQALCTDCHASESRMAGAPHPVLVNDFGTDHPDFRLRVTRFTDGVWQDTRITRDAPGLREASGLIFPHDVHLAPEGVEGPEGVERLSCASCHQPETGNIAMRPIEMERDCARCHRLDFEPGDPGARVPHGEVRDLHAYLRQYYALRALQGGYEGDDVPAMVSARRLPGERLRGAAREAALEWAEDKAVAVAREVFAYRVCTTCHEVRDNAAEGWQVLPVRLNQDWYPAARYTHAPHLPMQCTDCHAAESSHEASDILMPDIAECRVCHGGERSTARVASTCVDCHKFHQAQFYLMGDTELDDETGVLFRRR